MLFGEYAFLCFFWNCLLSIDYVQRIDAMKRKKVVSSWSSFWTLLMVIVNVVLLQCILPVTGYIYFFKDLPPEQRRLALWFVGIIVSGSILVILPYFYLVKHWPRIVTWFLCAALCVSMSVFTITVKYFDEKHEGLLDTWDLIMLTVFLFSYGTVCLLRISKNLRRNQIK